MAEHGDKMTADAMASATSMRSQEDDRLLMDAKHMGEGDGNGDGDDDDEMAMDMNTEMDY